MSSLTCTPPNGRATFSRAPTYDSTTSSLSSKPDTKEWETLLSNASLSSTTAQLAKALLEAEREGNTMRFEVDPSAFSLGLTSNSNSITNFSLFSSNASILHISRAPSAFLNPIIPSTSSTSKPPLKILSLDGGGVRGLSALQILSSLQTLLMSLGNSKPPCEIFDLICGTSTGGLIALMIGRMGMTVDNCIRVYKNLAKRIFKSMLPERAARYVGTDARLDSEILEKMVRAVILARLDDANASMASDAPSFAKTFVVSVLYSAMDKASPVLFRTYSTPTNPASTCPIYQAARATSAAPTWFAPQSIDGNLYIDGGIGHNNPTLLAVKEIKSLYPDREIGLILSLGTGTKHDISAKNPKRACIGYTTSSLGVHLQIEEKYGKGDDPIYFRFDVPDIGSTVGLGDWDKIKYLEQETEKYIASEEVQRELERCAKKFFPLTGANSTKIL